MLLLFYYIFWYLFAGILIGAVYYHLLIKPNPNHCKYHAEAFSSNEMELGCVVLFWPITILSFCIIIILWLLIKIICIVPYSIGYICQKLYK